ncbi:MAG: hypothetical protein HQL32_08425 [Planctomycetes bacterium]|nr:hypothetical protein [Planctomycetota bacterium]
MTTALNIKLIKYLLLVWFAFCTLHAKEATFSSKIALFTGYTGYVDPVSLEQIRKSLSDSHVVSSVSLKDILEEKATELSKYNALIIPDAPRCPAVMWEHLHRYMKQGGDVVFLGGKPFSQPSYKLGQVYRSRQETRKILENVPFTSIPNVTNPSRYHRDAFTQDTRSVINKWREGGVYMFIDARDWYDTFVFDIPPSEVVKSATLIKFCLKGNSSAKQICIKIQEHDGSTWFRKVNISPKKWENSVFMGGDFNYISGGVDREKTKLNLSQIKSCAFGQDYNHAGLHNGFYNIYLKNISLSNELKEVDFPQGDLSQDFRIPSLYPYEPYDIFDMHEVVRVQSFENSPFSQTFSLSAHYSGVSAIGQAPAEDGFYIPLCKAYGKYDDSLGWAGGALIHTGGEFKDSHWLFFNMPGLKTYTDSALCSLLSEMIHSCKDNSILSKKPTLPPIMQKKRAPHKIGFVKRSEDGTTLLTESGAPFFMVGSNYIYPMNNKSFSFWDKNKFSDSDLAIIERDFRKMQAAGINTIRIFGQEAMVDCPELNQKIKDLCHRLGIQILLQIVTHSYDATEKEVLNRARHIVSGFKNDPAVFAYDIQNEPQIAEIGAISYNNTKSPILKLDITQNHKDHYKRDYVKKLVAKHKKGRGGYPKMAPWMEDKKDVEKLYAADSIWKTFDASYSPRHRSLLHKYPRNLYSIEHLRDFFQAINDTYKQWYDSQAALIRSLSPQQLVTIGYNRGLVALPFNKDIDFISQHSYFRARSNKEVMLYTQIQDKLRELWPSTPVSIGEFAYSSGELYGDEYISNDSSCIAEFMMYLYSYSKGYNGAMRWRLNDDEIPSTFKNHHWLRNFNHEERVRQARFGMYVFDGYAPVPKPIVHCLSFFRDYLDSFACDRGTLVSQPNTQVSHINTSYIYRAKQAYFIGSTQSYSGPLRFKAPRSQAAQVLSMWNRAGIRIMSTVTMEVRVYPSELNSIFSSPLEIEGRHGSLIRHKDYLSIVLIKGEEITLSHKK